ncbi:hypothetical protein GJ496_000879 [Pomphorhynchus laevis]|nr:hypothetical protein GJ496_000879 [Pomphorhynchus laevis]
MVGLEIHAALRSRSKLFSAASALDDGTINSQVCPFDLAEPGTLPLKPSASCVRSAIRACLAFDSKINLRSTFDRKHYLYIDLPAGYQISQVRTPLATGGCIRINNKQTVNLQRIHIEHDTATSSLNFNRAGIGLVEIITEPFVINKENQVTRVIDEIRLNLQLARAIRTASLHSTPIRADINVSCHRDDQCFGIVEFKNLSRSKEINSLLQTEFRRQKQLVESGKAVIAQTLHRSDSLASDRFKTKYMCLPEPNLPDLILSENMINEQAKSMHSMPWQIREFCLRQGVEENKIRKLLKQCLNYVNSERESDLDASPFQRFVKFVQEQNVSDCTAANRYLEKILEIT